MEQTDWLGFNRIGSPDTTPRQKTDYHAELDLSTSLPLPSSSSATANKPKRDEFELTTHDSPARRKLSSAVDNSLTNDATQLRRNSLAPAGDGNKTVSDWLDNFDDVLAPRSDKRSSVAALPASRKGSMDFSGLGDNRATSKSSLPSFLGASSDADQGSKASK